MPADGHGYLYGEFSEHLSRMLLPKKWLWQRKKVIVIGKLAFVAPTKGERYFLRLLLLNVRGPKSFKDLLIVYGYRCATFQEAAIKLRLLEEDNAIDKCLAEACDANALCSSSFICNCLDLLPTK